MTELRKYQPQRYEEALKLVMAEIAKARENHAPMRGTHEGYAVILEELDELWDEIKANAGKKRMQEEAIQVAAMAIAFIAEVAS